MNSSDLADRFQQKFDAIPQIFRAPGRVNLIGEHTDYNGGFVMPAAIGFHTDVAIAPSADGKLVLHSENFPEEFEFNMDNLPQQRLGKWSDYVLGVAEMLRRRGHGISGANILISGNMSVGAGLSSSASIEVASALAFASLNQIDLPLRDVAQLCQKAENTFVGARVGIMDPFVSCMGKENHAVFLDCQSLDHHFVPIPSDLQFVICNTMVKHQLAAGEYNVRRQECEEAVRIFREWNPHVQTLRNVSIEDFRKHEQDLPSTIRKRCLHVIGENQRVLEAMRCLEAANYDRLGSLMRESHRSLRDLYEVSCRELDVMVEAAEGLPGYCGGRMTGGGFGGCTINLVRRENAEEFALQIAERYRQATDVNPQTYICSAVSGAARLQ